MRNFAFVSAMFLAMLLTGCSQTNRTAEPQIVHVVVVWLKNPGSEADRQKLIDTSRGFVGKIPGIVRVQVGPVLPSTRPMVDSSFDVALVMTFDSEKSLREYDTNPVHKQAVKDVLQPLAGKVVIYDATDRK